MLNTYVKHMCKIYMLNMCYIKTYLTCCLVKTCLKCVKHMLNSRLTDVSIFE